MPNEPAVQLHEEDLALAQRLLAKDRKAFDAFFAAYFSRLYRFAMTRLQDPALCEDIVQETLTKGLKAAAQYRGEATLHTWLCQICRNEISSWMRKEGVKAQRNVSLDDDPQVRAALESASAVQFDYADDLAAERLVHLTLDYLPEKYGKALEWKYVQGMSVDEIAEKMNVTSIVVQSLLARARRAFKTSYIELQQQVRTSA